MGVLALLALALITVSFRESDSGPLHGAQNAATTALHPFQVAVERVARPFRDAWGWSADLIHAKGDADRLRRQVEDLQQQVVQNESALKENVDLKSLLDYREGPTFPADYRGIAARVVSTAPTAFQQEIVVSAGANDGVVLNAPVVTAAGLVGHVTRVFSRAARVTLITDEQSAVSAIDLRTNAAGIVRHGEAGGTLVLDRIDKKDFVKRGDEIVTSGSRSSTLASLYPKGIRIGVVTSVNQTDTDLYKRVQIEASVDVSNVHSVLVLIAEGPPR